MRQKEICQLSVLVDNSLLPYRAKKMDLLEYSGLKRGPEKVLVTRSNKAVFKEDSWWRYVTAPSN